MNNKPFSVIYTSVRLFKAMLAVLLALGWVPLTAHCQLESVTGLELLRCHSAAEAPPPGNSHCNDSLCCGWESGQYHVPQRQPLSPPPLPAVVPPVALAAPDNTFPAGAGVSVLTAAPPEMSGTWQFFFRAALPVRAPSFAS